MSGVNFLKNFKKNYFHEGLFLEPKKGLVLDAGQIVCTGQTVSGERALHILCLSSSCVRLMPNITFVRAPYNKYHFRTC